MRATMSAPLTTRKHSMPNACEGGWPKRAHGAAPGARGTPATSTSKSAAKAELPTRGAPNVYSRTRLSRTGTSPVSSAALPATSSTRDENHGSSARSLKPRDASTPRATSGAKSVASAPPSEWPVTSTSQSPGVPTHAATRSSLSLRLTARADAKKPACTTRSSSERPPSARCSSGVCSRLTSVSTSITSDVPRKERTTLLRRLSRHMATWVEVGSWST
mmetsp:Transcript_23567/g.78286  ORF Transcript_23567/g.78286 Transcript_23567/m.78286 type:complete len:219 (-) Transcript_23567:242-898(-)